MLFLSGCCSRTIISLPTAKDIIKNYYESGMYDKELDKIYYNAKMKIDKMKIKNNSTAIFDIDDTALSNYEISKRLDYGYDYQIVQDWVMSSKLPAIKQTKLFYDFLKSKGIKLIFLTGRQSEEYEATYKNLIDTGYSGFDTLIVRAEKQRDISPAKFKSQIRKELTKKGYDIIICIGDQWSDIEGQYTGLKIKLPNYLYEIK
jgi:acid phosphatase